MTTMLPLTATGADDVDDDGDGDGAMDNDNDDYNDSVDGRRRRCGQ